MAPAKHGKREESAAAGGRDDALSSGAPLAAGPRGACSVRPDHRLLELLVCPVSKGPLEYDPARQVLISRSAGLVFPIRQGVPLLTLETARPLEEGGKYTGPGFKLS